MSVSAGGIVGIILGILAGLAVLLFFTLVRILSPIRRSNPRPCRQFLRLLQPYYEN